MKKSHWQPDYATPTKFKTLYHVSYITGLEDYPPTTNIKPSFQHVHHLLLLNILWEVFVLELFRVQKLLYYYSIFVSHGNAQKLNTQNVRCI